MKIVRLLCVWMLIAGITPAFAGYVIIDGKKIEVGPDRGEQMYKLIPIQSIEFKTIELICKPWMSENGVLTYEKKRGSIIVYDYKDIIEKIQKFIKDSDREVVNIRVEVQFDSKQSMDSVDWKAPRGKDGKITVQGGSFNIPGGLEVELPMRGNEMRGRNVTQLVMTESGRPASLWVGKSVVDPRKFNQLLGSKVVTYDDGRTVVIRYGVDEELAFVDVGAKLMVRPRYLDGGLIEVEVYPEVSYLNTQGAQESIEVEKIKTRVVVRQGSRINIGGVISKNLQVYKDLFGNSLYKKDDGRNVLDMYLRATVVKPRL